MDDTVIGVRVSDQQTSFLTAQMAASGLAAGARVAPQIALLLGSRLAGPGVTAANALAAVAFVHGAMCAVDGSFVTGPRGVRPETLDLSIEACLVEAAGRVHDSATGSAVPSGHPAAALAFAANSLAGRGQALEPGWIVLTGPLTAPVPVPAGSGLAVYFTTLGSVHLTP